MYKQSKEIRLKALELSKNNGGYHYGGSFSCAEILLCLYNNFIGPDDRFILSKGHGCWVYYAILQSLGYNPSLEGHPHRDIHNGVHWTTGSEGHGFPAGLGMAYAKKVQGLPGKVYVLIGDGEAQEGTTWESMLLAKKLGLDNLVVIVDNNKIQGSGYTNDILPVIESLKGAFQACGWEVSLADGHDLDDLNSCLMWKHNNPFLVIADTVKAKGICFAENKPAWHAKFPSKDEEKMIIEGLS